MTVDVPTLRLRSTEVSPDEAALKQADRLASAIRNRWEQGEAPDTSAALAQHPELRRYRTLALNLACEEYRLRQEAGESLDPQGFASRFPSWQKTLALMIEVRDLSAEDPELQGLWWPEAPGRFLGFDLIAEIGQGAFGRVFLASEPALGDRRVVVKIAPGGSDEAAILGKLDHPGIVPIHSVEQDRQSGLAAFCMPYLGRATLCDVIERAFAGPRPPRGAGAILEAIRAVEGWHGTSDAMLLRASYVDGVVHLGRQLAEALAHSHSRGIYHRDLKPSNVLMTGEGRPLLLDFNLSVDEGLPVERIGGTLPYMAPEEIAALRGPNKTGSAPLQPIETDGRAKGIEGTVPVPSGPTGEYRYDPRSDLFSLGVILYELLTGQLPFGDVPEGGALGEKAERWRQQQAAGARPVRQGNPHVDRRLARLIEDCLAFDPQARPATAQQLAAALGREVAPWRRVGRWIGCHRAIAGALLAAAMVVVLAVSLLVATRPPYSVRQYRRGLAYVRQGDHRAAIECYTDAVHADPGCHEALFARGRAEQQLGDFRLAYEDYQMAYKIAPSPLAAACSAYCMARLRQPAGVIGVSLGALKQGAVSPVLLNNLGFSYRQMSQLDEAELYLRQALRADDTLQAASHNLLMVFRDRAFRGQGVSDEALAHARRVLETGQPSGELYRDLAQLYACAAKRDPKLVASAIECVRRAVEAGADPAELGNNPTFSGLRKDKAFAEALTARVVQRYPRPGYYVDPLDAADMAAGE